MGLALTAVTAVVAAGSQPAAAVVSTYGNSGCTSPSDPANLHFTDVNLVVTVSPQTRRGWQGAKFISDQTWSYSGLSGSSAQYYVFSDRPCHNHDGYSINHGLTSGGNHVRFWDGATWANVRSGAHYDVPCGAGHSVSNWNTPRNTLAQFWVNWIDFTGVKRFTRTNTLSNIPKNWLKGCGYSPYDDGYIANLDQAAAIVYP